MTTTGGVQSSAVTRRSAPALTADWLREQITSGALQPGARIAVESLSRTLEVSANTLREALQLLEQERLVVQRLNKGIFVRLLSSDDILDLYAMRRLLELGTLRLTRMAPPGPLEAMRRAIDDGTAAIEAQDWSRSSRATTDFHAALVSMLGSERATTTMKRLMAELRLTLFVLDEHLNLRSPFLARRRHVLEAVEDGRLQDAERLLAAYLDDAEKAMLDIHAGRADS